MSSSGFSCILSVMLRGFTRRKKGPKKNKLHDRITVTCAKKVLQWHLSMLYLVHWFSLKSHIQILYSNREEDTYFTLSVVWDLQQRLFSRVSEL